MATLSYTRVPQSQEDLSVEEHGEQHNLPLIGKRKSHTHRSCCQTMFLTAISIVLFGGACLLFAASLTILAPTPMLEAVEYYEVDWANEFDQESIYRGSPTPKLELAWSRLWRHSDINVPLNRLPSLNRSMDANWKLTPAQYGGGAEANVEVFHQLHCLNMIRQYTYLDSYEVPPEGLQRSPEMSRAHINHCIETLRIHLMCTVDVTPVLVRLDESKPLGGEADFSTHHKCRRFDKLTEWMEMHAVPVET